MSLAAALGLLVSGCGSEDDGPDPRAALLRYCEASGGDASCACGVDLMMDTLDAPQRAVVGTLADAATDGADPAILLLEMVEGGELEPQLAQSLVAVMADLAERISAQCGG